MAPGHVTHVLTPPHRLPSLHLSESRLPVFKQFCLVGPAGSILGVLCCLPEKDGASHPHLAKVPTSCLVSPSESQFPWPCFFFFFFFFSVLFLLQECPSFRQTCMNSVRSIWDAGSKVPQPGSPILHQSPGHSPTLPSKPRGLQAKRILCICWAAAGASRREAKLASILPPSYAQPLAGGF